METNVLSVTKLVPKDSHKSFYGKALVKQMSNGTSVLQSYDTDVCKRDAKGNIIRLWPGWSVTTGRHIAAFCGMSKKKFTQLPINKN